MSTSYILDACALIALLKNEDGADKVENILIQAKEKSCTVFMSKYNLLEVYYGFYKADGEAVADKRIQAVKSSPITIIDTFSDEVFKHAGRLKASYKISLADSIVLAEGIDKNATVVSSDHHEFDAVEKTESIVFMWIR